MAQPRLHRGLGGAVLAVVAVAVAVTDAIVVAGGAAVAQVHLHGRLVLLAVPPADGRAVGVRGAVLADDLNFTHLLGRIRGGGNAAVAAVRCLLRLILQKFERGER